MEFKEVIRKREAVRKFKGVKPTEEQLQQIFEAGNIAPTAFNKQPQRIYLLESEESLATMDSVHPCRYNAPVVMLVCADKNASSSFQGSSSYLTDGTIAATHMMLAATNVGLDSCWAGVSDVVKTQQAFDLPENIHPICFLDLGFRSDEYKGSATHHKRNSIESMLTRL